MIECVASECLRLNEYLSRVMSSFSAKATTNESLPHKSRFFYSPFDIILDSQALYWS